LIRPDSEEKELSNMPKHRRLFWSLALSALIGLMASEARAETITMTLTVGGGPSFVVDAVAVVGATTYNVDSTGIAAINSFLATNGSEYRFVSLGGSSNFPGDPTQGQLVATGEIHSVGTAGANAVLSLSESEAGFTSPTGPSGTLMSSSTGNFTNQPAGGGHTASSSFNAIVTPTYSVLSTTTNPNGAAGAASVGVAPVPTLYKLDNAITFGLAHPASTGPDIVDSFGVTATIRANAVPEPASLVTMLTGLPLPLVVVGLLRRRRAMAKI